MDKIKKLFGSKRFWLVTVGALSAIGGAWAGGVLTAEFVFNTVTVWAATVAGIGSIDKWTNSV